MECEVCQAERSIRNRLVDGTERDATEAFVAAPYITRMNKPKQLAAQERAKDFAKYYNNQIFWIYARDTPKTGEIKNKKGEELQKARETWLKRHDQDTAGVMGFFPASYNLPVRFTQTLDKDRRILKGTTGRLVGWDLNDIDHEKIQACRDREVVLDKLPKALLIKRDGKGMPQHEDLEPEVHRVCHTAGVQEQIS